MDIEFVEGWPKGNKVRLLIKNTDSAQVNALRRTIIADVPKLAISRVDFSQGVTQDNKGEVFESVNALPDEVLAHRLAMVPVPTNPDEGLYFPDECPNCIDLAPKDKGCPSCQVLYTLSSRGPNAEAEDQFKTVYTGDLTTISDPIFDVREEHRRIPLTILAKGQYLEFYAFAVLGRGRDHAKFTPASAITFRPNRKAILNNAKAAETLFALDLTANDGTKIDKKLFTKNECTDVDKVLDLEKAMHQVGPGTGRDEAFADAITFETIPNEFVFMFESDGSLTPEQIMNSAMSELKDRFSRITEELDFALA